jgi:5-hydroxyisourate hydrolase-like protein (transthyretin family)
MIMSKKTLKKIAVYSIVAVLLSIFELVPIRSAMAVTPTIGVSPTSGVIGTLVTVSGEINTTDGAFTVRWNQAFNFTGVAVGNNYTTSFSVPATAGGIITVELIDDTLGTVVATTNFTLFVPEFHVRIETPLPLSRLQEGNKTSIVINVTGGLPNTIYPANITVKNPANQTHSAVILLSNTTSTGSGNGTATYPADFLGGAHTNLNGTYSVSSNLTVGVAEFFVGLTDKIEYLRKETVRVQAAGYKASEKVNVDIRTSASVSGFPKNVTASSSGLVTLTWAVPVNATRGTYHVVLTNTTADGTVKTPSDAQDFVISGFVCSIQAKNLAGEPVEGASIKVYNANTTTTVLNEGNTNSTGWIIFSRDEGNYTFKAFFNNVEVGLLANELITADTELHMNLSLTNFLATVRTEGGEGVPLIDVSLTENKTGTQTAAGQTNATGMVEIRNLFTNRTYRVEATRYGLLFSSTTVDVVPLPEDGLVIHSLTLWNQQLNVHTVDAEDESAVGVDIRVYEWTSGTATPLDSATTDFSGDVFLSLPFGRYILRAFKGDDFLSEIVVDLDEPTALTFDLATLNVNVIVSVLDYFGQPLANAEVKIERKIGQDFVLISTKLTDTAGTAQFVEMVGGDSRVSVNLGGTLVAVKTQFLGAGSSEVAIKVAEYVAIAGYPLQTGAFALLIFILVVIVVVLVAARKRVMQVFQRSSKR